MRDPIIILGMHRSGTTLITKILSEFNVFWGADLDINQESMFFHTINEWILRRIGGSWSYPDDIKYLLNSPKLVSKITKILQTELNSIRFYQYLGMRNIFRKKRILNSKWGWKDPRNVFTLPLWMNIFKTPKIIYIKRNGIDIAASLVKRQKKFIESDINNPFINYTFRQKFKNFFSPIEIHQYNALKCIDILEAYKIWEIYTDTAENIFNRVRVPKIDLKYEDLLTEPNKILKELMNFIQVSAKEEKINKITSRINKSRRFAFLDSDEMVQFYLQHKNDRLMKLLGYDKLL